MNLVNTRFQDVWAPAAVWAVNCAVEKSYCHSNRSPDVWSFSAELDQPVIPSCVVIRLNWVNTPWMFSHSTEHGQYSFKRCVLILNLVNTWSLDVYSFRRTWSTLDHLMYTFYKFTAITTHFLDGQVQGCFCGTLSRLDPWMCTLVPELGQCLIPRCTPIALNLINTKSWFLGCVLILLSFVNIWYLDVYSSTVPDKYLTPAVYHLYWNLVNR